MVDIESVDDVRAEHPQIGRLIVLLQRVPHVCVKTYFVYTPLLKGISQHEPFDLSIYAGPDRRLRQPCVANFACNRFGPRRAHVIEGPSPAFDVPKSGRSDDASSILRTAAKGNAVPASRQDRAVST